MTVKLAPIVNDAQFSTTDGLIANGYQLFFYEENTTTKKDTYTTNAGDTANSNPIVLDTYGRVPSAGQVWLTEGTTGYKIVLAPPADTDPPASGVVLADYVHGINDFSGQSALNQWQASGLTPTYLTATTFTVPGDQTSVLHAGRRLMTSNTGGTIYSTITATAFTSVTTVTVVNDSGVLDSGLGTVSFGILTSVGPSVPKVALPDGSTGATQSADDGSTLLATTQYADTQALKESGNFSGVVSVTDAAYTLLAANAGKIHLCSGSASAITMPAIAGSTTSDSFCIVNQLATNITVTRDGSSTFAGISGSTTEVVIGGYSSANITKTGAAVWSVSAYNGSALQRVIASGAITSVSNLEFILSTLDATQATTNAYLLRLIGYQPATDDRGLYLTVSSDAGSSYLGGTGYSSILSGYDATGFAKYEAVNAGAQMVVSGNSVGGESMSNATDETAFLDLTLSSVNTGTSLFPSCKMIGGFWTAAATPVTMSFEGYGSNNAGAADFDAVKLTWEGGGNFAPVGSYVLYKIG